MNKSFGCIWTNKYRMIIFQNVHKYMGEAVSFWNAMNDCSKYKI